MSRSSTLDVAIVGAGAAGLMAGIFAGRRRRELGLSPRDFRIAAFDGARRIGAKILVAGGGRCNVTHARVEPADFFGGSRRLVGRVLRSFSVEAAVAFFADLGVRLKTEETGKLFPVSDDAHTVLEALLRGLEDAGVELHAGCRVLAVTRAGDAFALATPAGPVRARRVILATGGMSLPRTGSDGAGYAIARGLGHTVLDPFPALAPLTLPPKHWLTELTGLSVEATVDLRDAAGKVLHRERGPVLLAHFGLTGPAILNISRHWIAARRAGDEATLAANLLGVEFAAADERLLRWAQGRPRAAVADLLRGMLPERLAAALCRHAADVDPATPAAHLDRDARRRLTHALVALPLPVTGDRGFAHAEVTAGGVPLDEIDPATMRSRRTPGLLLCGEILDVDGRIGGFNFQWAWASGRLAGIHAAPDAAGPASG